MAMGTARGEEDVEKITIKNKPTTSLTDGIIQSSPFRGRMKGLNLPK